MHIEHSIDLLPYATDFHTKFLDTCYHGLIIICFSESNIKLYCHQSLKAAACLLGIKSIRHKRSESRDEYQNNISHDDIKGEGSKTSTTVILIPKTDQNVLLFNMKEENILAIPGILSVTIFDQRGKVVFAYGKTVNNEQQNQALFRTFRYIHGQSIRSRSPLRIGFCDELFLCTMTASGDIIGRHHPPNCAGTLP